MPNTDKRMTGLKFAVAGLAGLAAMASVFMTGDDLLRSQFDTAFNSKNLTAVQMNRPQAPAVQPVAASEDYWLGDIRRSQATPAAWNQNGRIVLGDRIQMTMKGVKRELEVIAVKVGPFGLLNGTRSGAQLGKAPLLVTLRTVGTNDRPIHLLLDDSQALQDLARAPEHPHEL